MVAGVWMILEFINTLYDLGSHFKEVYVPAVQKTSLKLLMAIFTITSITIFYR